MLILVFSQTIPISNKCTFKNTKLGRSFSTEIGRFHSCLWNTYILEVTTEKIVNSLKITEAFPYWLLVFEWLDSIFKNLDYEGFQDISMFSVCIHIVIQYKQDNGKFWKSSEIVVV